MPYISTDRVAEIRAELKNKYPEIKFSITREHGSTVSISILESYIDFKIEEGTYRQVNVYHISTQFTGDARDILLDIYNIANSGNGIMVNDGDYGNVPNFYVNINIGKWDKPYKINGEAPAHAKKVLVSIQTREDVGFSDPVFIEVADDKKLAAIEGVVKYMNRELRITYPDSKEADVSNCNGHYIRPALYK